MTKDMPFISLGSGKMSADPFLGFLRKVYWPSNLPTIQEAALAAYWTIRHAIDMKVLGVGFGVDVFTIEPSAKTCMSAPARRRGGCRARRFYKGVRAGPARRPGAAPISSSVTILVWLLRSLALGIEHERN